MVIAVAVMFICGVRWFGFQFRRHNNGVIWQVVMELKACVVVCVGMVVEVEVCAVVCVGVVVEVKTCIVVCVVVCVGVEACLVVCVGSRIRRSNIKRGCLVCVFSPSFVSFARVEFGFGT